MFQILFYFIGIVVYLYTLTTRLRARYPSEELYKSGPALDSFYKYNGFFSRKYHPIWYLYEFVAMARKYCISLITTLSNRSGGKDQEIYFFLFAALYFVFGMIHLLKQPLRTKELNFLDALLTLVVQIGT